MYTLESVLGQHIPIHVYMCTLYNNIVHTPGISQYPELKWRWVYSWTVCTQNLDRGQILPFSSPTIPHVHLDHAGWSQNLVSRAEAAKLCPHFLAPV